jgi:hypothetical protein
MATRCFTFGVKVARRLEKTAQQPGTLSLSKPAAPSMLMTSGSGMPTMPQPKLSPSGQYAAQQSSLLGRAKNTLNSAGQTIAGGARQFGANVAGAYNATLAPTVNTVAQNTLVGAANTLRPLGAAYERNVSPETRQMFNDMSANSARTATGIISTLAGGVGTAATGAVAGATNAWNAMTPKSMNTSQEWSQGANDALTRSVNLVNNGAKDVVGSLGGNQDYNTQHSWNQIEQGYNDPSVDPTTRAIAATGAWGGSMAGNTAIAMANPGQIAARGLQAGTNAARGAQNLVRAGKLINTTDTMSGLGEFGNAVANAGVGVNQAMTANEQAAQPPTEMLAAQ